MNMHAVPDLPHRQPNRLVQFAFSLTAAAALLAWLLASVARLSEPVTVITVMTLAFCASWAITNHRSVPTHRVTVVPARARAH